MLNNKRKVEALPTAAQNTMKQQRLDHRISCIWKTSACALQQYNIHILWSDRLTRCEINIEKHFLNNNDASLIANHEQNATSNKNGTLRSRNLYMAPRAKQCSLETIKLVSRHRKLCFGECTLKRRKLATNFI